MIVLSFGSERKLFSNNPTADRIIRLGSSFEQYHMVVFTLKKDSYAKVSHGSMTIYPTNSISKMAYLFDAFWIMIRIAKKLSPEEKNKTVITTQDPFEAGFLGLVIAKLFGLKLHVQIHTDLFSPFFKNTWMQYIRMIIAPVVIAFADALRCDSQRMKDVIIKKQMSSAPVDVLPIYINTEKYRTDQTISQDVHRLFAESRLVFLMASRLEPEKDIRNTIIAFASIIKKYPNRAGLVIVGSGSCENELKTTVHDLGVGDDVVFIPWTNDLQSYYCSTDVFMITSLFEGYGLTIAESLLCGTPVLATDVGVVPEVIVEGKTGWIVPAKNRDLLAQKINQLIGHPEHITKARDYLAEKPYRHSNALFDDYQKAYLRNLEKALL